MEENLGTASIITVLLCVESIGLYPHLFVFLYCSLMVL